MILLLGATGATGSHILRLALDQGHRVRAFVRRPDKISESLREHERLEVVQGDLTDHARVRDAIEGCAAVIITVSNPKLSQRGPFMLELVEAVVDGMRIHGVERLLYQGGAFTSLDGQPQPAIARFFYRPLLFALGKSGSLRDNDDVARFLHSQAHDIFWTVLRPGLLREGPARGSLTRSDSYSAMSTFTDLAQLHLDSLSEENWKHSLAWIKYVDNTP